jgi:NADPH-dependent glutamate synthase beta subunit-like oxidoreductase
MTSRSIAVVGSGPSGLYAADALVRLDPEATIHIYERLPTPFGLIRFGVAPDHPGTKAVTRQFDRLMARPNLRFLGNVEVGRNPDLDELQAAYDLVIMATGAPRDRRMDIEGDEPGQIYGSAAITGWYNGHPDHSDETPVIGRRGYS